MSTDTVLPPQDPHALDGLAEALRAEPRPRLVGADGSATDLPDEVYTVLVEVAEAMRGGRAITVAPVSQRLTTSEAAEMLGISRPTLVKLLEDGEIPFEQPRRHRVLRLDDVLAFRARRRRQRRDALDEMTRQAVADGLYEATAEDYDAAIRRTRRG